MHAPMRRENHIAGAWRPAQDRLVTRNPSDLDEVVGEYACASAHDVDDAVAAARSAGPGWRDATATRRAEVLDRAGDLLLARADSLGELLAREEGKPLAEARGEAVRAGQIFKFFAGETYRACGELLPPVRAGVRVEARREPLGAVGLITPWNFPIAIPAWKTAPALAFGCTVVLKPSEIAPGCAVELVSILADAGLPAGVFNLVMGTGPETGARLVGHPGLEGVSFTGSRETGQQIAERCAAAMQRCQLEMGGKNPLIVLDDADLDLAVEGALNGAYFATGQRCTASSRLIVTRGAAEAFTARLIQNLKALPVGHALDPSVRLGPLASQHQLEKSLGYIEAGRQDGGELVAGGELLSRPTRGLFLSPALFTGVTNSMRIAQEEIFGPVAAIIVADDPDHALALANETRFGLSAGVYTRSLRLAAMFQDRLEAGMVMVNLPTAGVDFHAPFGGVKASSLGPREQGGHAREFYTRWKTSYVFAS